MFFIQWVDEQCVPLVREITFNNAEEITEEGLPLMILFHKKEATKDVETYTQAAQRWLFSQKGKINIVTATAEQVLSRNKSSVHRRPTFRNHKMLSKLEIIILVFSSIVSFGQAAE